MAEIPRVNWVTCPKCKYRYYVGPQLIMVEGVLSVCPKCHHEYNVRSQLENKVTEVSAAAKLF